MWLNCCKINIYIEKSKLSDQNMYLIQLFLPTTFLWSHPFVLDSSAPASTPFADPSERRKSCSQGPFNILIQFVSLPQQTPLPLRNSFCNICLWVSSVVIRSSKSFSGFTLISNIQFKRIVIINFTKLLILSYENEWTTEKISRSASRGRSNV